MISADFERHVSELRSAVIGTIEAHFQAHRLAFDVRQFLSETGVDIDLFLREAYFYGAEVFPLDVE